MGDNLDNNIDKYNISYFENSKWNIEGMVSISNGKYENAYGEVNVQKNTANDGVSIHRIFSLQSESDIMYFEFNEELSMDISETNILRYESTNPLVGEALKGLYIVSFDFIHAMYAELLGGSSVQEVFIKKDNATYLNNGIMFRTGKLYLRWNLEYKIQ